MRSEPAKSQIELKQWVYTLLSAGQLITVGLALSVTSPCVSTASCMGQLEIASSSYGSRTVKWMHNFLSAKHLQWIGEENLPDSNKPHLWKSVHEPQTLTLSSRRGRWEQDLRNISTPLMCADFKINVSVSDNWGGNWEAAAEVRCCRSVSGGVEETAAGAASSLRRETHHKHRDREMNDTACQVGGLVSQTWTCSDTFNADFNCIMIVFKGGFWKNCPNLLTNYIHTSNCELNNMSVTHSKGDLGIT